MARKLLGAPRAASVFTPPCRLALEATSWAEAAEINERCTGKRLSRQAWGISRKIREVDRFLRRGLWRQQHLREVHPEVIFWALNGRKPLHTPKKRVEGRKERLTVLASHWPDAELVFHRERKGLSRQGASADDLIDALVSVTAWRACRGDFETIPNSPHYDGVGIRMEILYPMEQRRETAQ